MSRSPDMRGLPHRNPPPAAGREVADDPLDRRGPACRNGWQPCRRRRHRRLDRHAQRWRPATCSSPCATIRDGHDFVAEALAAGAAAAMVDRDLPGLPPEAPLLRVADTLAGLHALGAAGRARCTGQVAAVTGSVGKTGTKEMLRLLLGALGPTHAAIASYNNHWGVPLTLARMPAGSAFAVIEIGMNNPGEIAAPRPPRRPACRRRHHDRRGAYRPYGRAGGGGRGEGQHRRAACCPAAPRCCRAIRHSTTGCVAIARSAGRRPHHRLRPRPGGRDPPGRGQHPARRPDPRDGRHPRPRWSRSPCPPWACTMPPMPAAPWRWSRRSGRTPAAPRRRSRPMRRAPGAARRARSRSPAAPPCWSTKATTPPRRRCGRRCRPWRCGPAQRRIAVLGDMRELGEFSAALHAGLAPEAGAGGSGLLLRAGDGAAVRAAAGGEARRACGGQRRARAAGRGRRCGRATWFW